MEAKPLLDFPDFLVSGWLVVELSIIKQVVFNCLRIALKLKKNACYCQYQPLLFTWLYHLILCYKLIDVENFCLFGSVAVKYNFHVNKKACYMPVLDNEVVYVFVK